MPTAYCIKCKKNQAIKDPQNSAFKNGTPIMAGSCSVCGGKLFRILPKRPPVAGAGIDSGEANPQA